MSAPAPEFPANSPPYDPYGNFRFKVKWDGRYVAGFSKVSLPENGPRSAPGQPTVVLEQGVTQDAAFLQWMNQVLSLGAPVDDRQDLIIELYNEAGQAVLAYTARHCWPVDAMPEPAATGDATAIQSLEFQADSLERGEPQSP